MQFEVPQFIEIEDKIIGPLTWKQFVYIAGGVGILIILFLSLDFLFFVLFGLPISALSGALAFHRVNNRPFSIFLESAVKYFSSAKLYLWHREVEQSVIEKKEGRTTREINTLSITKNTIRGISRKL